jgi:hypothetical protein
MIKYLMSSFTHSSSYIFIKTAATIKVSLKGLYKWRNISEIKYIVKQFQALIRTAKPVRKNNKNKKKVTGKQQEENTLHYNKGETEPEFKVGDWIIVREDISEKDKLALTSINKRLVNKSAQRILQVGIYIDYYSGIPVTLYTLGYPEFTIESLENFRWANETEIKNQMLKEIFLKT